MRDTMFQVAVQASADGKFTFQIFTLSGEPRTYYAGTQSYETPTEAAQAGYNAIAAGRLHTILARTPAESEVFPVATT
jgi:hypothetical protein